MDEYVARSRRHQPDEEAHRESQMNLPTPAMPAYQLLKPKLVVSTWCLQYRNVESIDCTICLAQLELDFNRARLNRMKFVDS